MKRSDWEKYFLAEAKSHFKDMRWYIDIKGHPELVNFFQAKMYYSLFFWAGYRA
jgi:hypothetical protein